MNMRTLAPAALISALLATLLSAPALAGTITLDFETAPSFGSIGNTYAASGVSFGGDALGLANDGTGSGFNGDFFSHAPSPLGVMFVAGADGTMNVAGGFYAIDFFYSSADALADAVQVWSGLDGSGTLLASFGLTANATLGCSDSAFCHWTQVGASLTGTAHSMTFSPAAAAAFDNIRMLPEPGSALLAGLGLAALLALRKGSQPVMRDVRA
jgi:hypothetical protein